MNKGDEKFWEVEDIRGLMKKEGKYFYFVKWKGFSNNFNSWEPEDHFSEGCIKDYGNGFLEGWKERLESGQESIMIDEGQESCSVPIELITDEEGEEEDIVEEPKKRGRKKKALCFSKAKVGKSSKGGSMMKIVINADIPVIRIK